MPGSPTSSTSPASELREFRRRHELAAEEEDTGEVELRDEIEAEIEATSSEAAEEDEEEDEDRGGRSRGGRREARGARARAQAGRRRRRRRRGRGGGGGDRAGAAMQATFDHGDDDGYGLWLDPAVADDPVYTEHWAGHRRSR